MLCPGCNNYRVARGKYLCPGCWYTLPGPTRKALNRRDADAGARLLTLRSQLKDGTHLRDIQIT